MRIHRKLIHTLSALLVTGTITAGQAASNLRVHVEAGDVSFTDFAVRDDQVWGRQDSKLVPIPADARWHLAGDFRPNAAFILLNPDYRMVRVPAFTTAPATGSLAYATVVVNSNTPWTEAQLRGGILFFVWAVNQQPVLIKPEIVEVHENWPGNFVAIAAFELGAKEQDGVPWVLLWKNGQFVRPRQSPFTHEGANTALADLHFGSREDFQRAVAEPKAVDARSRDDKLRLLHFASEAGNPAAVKALLDAGAEINASTSEKGTALHAAAEKGREAVVPTLLAAGAKELKRGIDGQTPAVGALTHGHAAVAAEMASALDAPQFAELARRAAFQGDVATIQALAASGETAGIAALHAAALHRCIELRDTGLFRALLDAGVRIDAKDGVSLTVAAAAQTNPAFVDALAGAGVSIAEPTAQQLTPLMIAASLGNGETAAALRRHGASVSATDDQDRTPLHHAVLSGDPGTVATLVPTSAVTAKDAAGHTPLDIALAMQAAPVVDHLVAAGANLDPAGPVFAVSLEHAIALDQADLVQQAIAHGWNPAESLRDAWSPADVARLCKARNVLALLGGDASDSRSPASIENKPDQPPALVQGEKPSDVRADSIAASASVEVLGVIDTNGRFLFPQITKSTDARLAFSVLQTVAGYKMRPAQKNGSAVNTQTKLAFSFGARSSEVFGPAPGVSPPTVRTRISPEPVARTIEQIGAPVAIPTTVAVYDARTGRYSYVRSTTYQAPERLPVNAAIPGWATATVLVERNGQPGIVQVVDASDPGFAQSAEKALRGYTFVPARQGNVTVRSRVTLVVTAVPE